MTPRPWLFALALAACGSPPPAAYTRENDAATAAQKSGDPRSAAAHYERAAAVAKNQRDAEESRYRAADSYARAGDLERAASLLRALGARGGERAARADFTLADMWEKHGDVEQADAARTLAIKKHPSSGLARKALEEHLRFLRQRGGQEAVLGYLRGEAATFASTELGESVLYRTARELDDAGKPREARDAYLACAERYAYPKGAYWDDALYRAAQKSLELDEPARAVELLRRLLAAQESANFTGSYERPRYAEAQLELGRLYRDRLKDPLAARRELRRVWENHRQSTLADDALFEEALVARASGDVGGTCAPLTILAKELPQSRFAPCAHLLCSSIEAKPEGCRDYVKRAAGLP